MQPLALEVQRCLSALQQIIAHALARPLICLLPLSALIQSIELILFCFGRYLLVVLLVVSMFCPPLSIKQEDKVFAAKSGILSYEFPVTCHSYLPHVSASQCRQVTPLACIRIQICMFTRMLVCICACSCHACVGSNFFTSMSNCLLQKHNNERQNRGEKSGKNNGKETHKCDEQ